MEHTLNPAGPIEIATGRPCTVTHTAVGALALKVKVGGANAIWCDAADTTLPAATATYIGLTSAIQVGQGTGFVQVVFEPVGGAYR